MAASQSILQQSTNEGATNRTAAVIIVSYNTKDLLRGCLKLVAGAMGDLDCTITVVDNASSDGSAKMVAAEFPDVTLIASNTNLGFAAANNLVIEQGREPFVILLNPDTEAEPGSLKRLVDFLLAHRDVGACGPMLLNSDGTIQRNGTRFPHLLGDILALTGLRRLCQGYWNSKFGHGRTNFDATCEVDWVSGACLAVKREVIDQVGVLDPRFFMFFEEVEWCHRIRKAGRKVYYVADARVVHHWMGSVKQSPKKMTAQLFRSQPQYYRMTSGRVASLAARAIMILGLAKNYLKYLGVSIKRQLRLARLPRQIRP